MSELEVDARKATAYRLAAQHLASYTDSIQAASSIGFQNRPPDGAGPSLAARTGIGAAGYNAALDSEDLLAI